LRLRLELLGLRGQRQQESKPPSGGFVLSGGV
jgi:hypothetical protein